MTTTDHLLIVLIIVIIAKPSGGNPGFWTHVTYVSVFIQLLVMIWRNRH